jgi:hypothetical protein
MPQWNNSSGYQGIPQGLLQQYAGIPSKKAAGLEALMQGLMGKPQQGQGTGVQGAIGQIPDMVQQQRLKQLLQYLQSQQGQQGPAGQGAGGSMMGGGGGMPNPMQMAMRQGTTMGNDPLGILGGQ